MTAGCRLLRPSRHPRVPSRRLQSTKARRGSSRHALARGRVNYVSALEEAEALVDLMRWRPNPAWTKAATASRLPHGTLEACPGITEALLRCSDEIRRLDRFSARAETRRRRAWRALAEALDTPKPAGSALNGSSP